eukprot:scaffold8934_cov94-Isochrysis_galbana.AAC.1
MLHRDLLLAAAGAWRVARAEDQCEGRRGRQARQQPAVENGKPRAAAAALAPTPAAPSAAAAAAARAFGLGLRRAARLAGPFPTLRFPPLPRARRKVPEGLWRRALAAQPPHWLPECAKPARRRRYAEQGLQPVNPRPCLPRWLPQQHRAQHRQTKPSSFHRPDGGVGDS